MQASTGLDAQQTARNYDLAVNLNIRAILEGDLSGDFFVIYLIGGVCDSPSALGANS